jgi:hypothetical protein
MLRATVTAGTLNRVRLYSDIRGRPGNQPAQFYSPLPFTLDPHYVREVDALLTVINAGLPIGHFGHKDDRELYHKHVFVAPQRQMIAEDLFVEMTLLFFGMQDSFGDAIEAVANGKKTAAEALTRLKIDPLPTRVSHTSAAPATLLQRIKDYLESISWPFSPVLDSAFVTQANAQNGSYTCFAQARESDQQLIFYSVSPLDTPPDRLGEMMAFITRANYGLVLGSFELDMDDGEIRFKTSIAVKTTCSPRRSLGRLYTQRSDDGSLFPRHPGNHRRGRVGGAGHRAGRSLAR